ncbi:alpha/beta hydrolase [Streptomyces sp. NA04227]|uniref:alpha/beta fold hydrolase n=1 Tax=Streptomyces sp. NA04227 TaxID=2742136 RepID=UPI00159114B8|nr:alpha/beta hydrolase [Streptomyces sp. NA04227]QKW11038.1 alpha/beta hydrolase [Streptomyces sp. NA04227]
MTHSATQAESAPSTAIFVHNIFTWGSDASYGFAAQRPLADRHRLLVPDRRGYGHSPDTERSDFEADADDLVALLDDVAGRGEGGTDVGADPGTGTGTGTDTGTGTGGVHLVGHGNGGVIAMLAAGRRPALVRSLTLIQPSAFTAAAEHPTIAALLERVAESGPGDVPDSMTAEEFLRASTEGIGLPMPEPTAQRLRAVGTSMRERPIWEARIPLEPLRDADWPTLVICGTWEDAPEMYRSYVGEPLMACAEALTASLGARSLRVPGFYPHTQQPEAVNAALRELWDGGCR